MLELLAPAGGQAALLAALRAGADAVYLGASFGARAYAGNFAGDALTEAVALAHAYGVKVYITLNTLLKDAEMHDFAVQAESAARAGVDAALVQDVAVAGLLRTWVPELPLHASTQMAIHNAQGVAWAARQGLSRVVLARECPLDDIALICKQAEMLGVEVEVFVHGALCVGVSGQCLMSAMAGGRSGNRGRCAQPCRLPYELTGTLHAEGDLLSPRDLCLIDRLDELAGAGVACVKIEGRMKTPEYVWAVTRAYRKAIDGVKPSADDILRLQAAFRRRGYGCGFFDGGDDANHLALSREERETMETPADAEVLAADIEKHARRIGVTMRFLARADQPLTLMVSDGVREVTATGMVAQTPRKAALLPGDIARQLNKTGETPYRVEDITVDAEAVFAPVSALNALRRQALEMLTEARVQTARAYATPEEPFAMPEPAAIESVATAWPDKPVFALASGACASAALQGGAQVLWQPDDWTPDGLSSALDALRADAENTAHALWLAFPPFLPTRALEAALAWALQNQRAFVGYAAGNPSHIGALSWRCMGQPSLHTLSAEASRAWRALGLETVTASPEANRAELRGITRIGPTLYPAQGRLPLMYLRHCPLRAARGQGGVQARCRACNGHPTAPLLHDRTGRAFPLRRYSMGEGCVQRVLNADVLKLDTHIDKLSGAAPLLMFWDEDAGFAALSVAVWKHLVQGQPLPEDMQTAWQNAWQGKRTTAGHLLRGVE